jgi:gliding motility-associated-like protein
VLYSEIVSNNELIVEAGDNVTIEAGTGVQLSATVNRAGNFLYQWMPEEDFENPLTSDPFVKPQKTITYRVMVTEENTNCSATDSLQVKVLPPGYLLFPSAFTPNGDGLNDVFFPVAEGLYLVTIERFAVYNRWGNLLHNNPSVGWDGTVGGLPEEMGTYVYEITYRVAGEQERISTRGNLTVLR